MKDSRKISKTLLPCPFCGNAAILRPSGMHRGICIVQCKRCYIHTEGYENTHSAVKAWNRRS